jgi:carbamoyltransferase|tara:strand:+ start:589 stop:2007 length:1419 start_codon:yes stop_codon:yes gene_type:complete
MTEQQNISSYIGIGGALHDTSIAALIDGEFRYRKSERAFGIKHHRADDKWFKSVLDEWGVDEKTSKIVYTDAGRKRFGRRVRKPYNGEDYIVEGDRICIDHHTAHVYSAQSYATQHAAFDGRGSGGYDGRWTGLTIAGDQKKYKDLSIGKYLSYVGYAMGFKGMEVDFPGKVMGLQAYGTPDIELAKQINQDNILDLCGEWMHRGIDSKDPKFQDFVATVHKACELIQLEYFKVFDPTKKISCSGGVMLNTVINTELRKTYDLEILPHVYDGGLSIGALRYAVGHNFDMGKFPYCQDDDAPEEVTDQTIEEAAELLAQGKIIGWYQGHGEIGPRALGNRSILMNPMIKDGKDILNSRVKKREWWRPFGASVLKEKAAEYFDIEDSPYMLYNAKVKQTGLDPITHVDGTCRHQTVTYESNSTYYKLISAFEKKTGCPILLNTSLNIGGKPIAGTPEDADVSGLDALIIGNQII